MERLSRAFCLVLTLAFASTGSAQLADESTAAVLRRYEEEDRGSPPRPGAVLFVGSSTVERWGWKNAIAMDFPGVRVLDRGVSGTSYAFLNEHIDELVFRYRPSRVVVYSGDNDTSEGVTPERIVEEAGTFVDRIHQRFPSIPVAVISIKPSPHLERLHLREHARKANIGLLTLTFTRPWLRFVDVYDAMLDPRGRPRPELFVKGGLHMNPDGYAIWTRIVRARLGL